MLKKSLFASLALIGAAAIGTFLARKFDLV